MYLQTGKTGLVVECFVSAVVHLLEGWARVDLTERKKKNFVNLTGLSVRHKNVFIIPDRSW